MASRLVLLCYLHEAFRDLEDLEDFVDFEVLANFTNSPGFGKFRASCEVHTKFSGFRQISRISRSSHPSWLRIKASLGGIPPNVVAFSTAIYAAVAREASWQLSHPMAIAPVNFFWRGMWKTTRFFSIQGPVVGSAWRDNDLNESIYDTF